MNPDDNYHEMIPTKVISNTQSGVNSDLNLVANARGLQATAISLTIRINYCPICSFFNSEKLNTITEEFQIIVHGWNLKHQLSSDHSLLFTE